MEETMESDLEYIMFIGIANFLNCGSSYGCIFTTWNERLSVFESISEISKNPFLSAIVMHPLVKVVFEPTTTKTLFCGCPIRNPYRLQAMEEKELSEVKKILKEHCRS
jgi:hypothetical protein